MANPVGRPTLYKEEYCEMLVDFFNIPLTTGSGKSKSASELPQFIDFAVSISVDYDTLLEWRDKHPKFSGAYKKAKKLQEKIIAGNAIQNRYNPYFAQFMLKNNHGWKDKTESDTTVKAEGFVLNLNRDAS